MKRYLLASIFILAAACEAPANAPQELATDSPLMLPGEEEGGGFFDEALLLDGAIDLEAQAPECVGASSEELERPDHPAIIRGQVLAPQARLARGSFFPQWLVPNAYAAPLEGELPVPNARVALYRQENGEPQGGTLIETRTNIAGAYCLRIPDEFEPGLDLILIATRSEDRRRLRRLFAQPGDIDISALSEVLVQILVDEELDLKNLPRATFLNMEVLASTAVDLLAPVVLDEGEDLSKAMAKIERGLRIDARFVAIIERTKP